MPSVIEERGNDGERISLKDEAVMTCPPSVASGGGQRAAAMVLTD